MQNTAYLNIADKTIRYQTLKYTEATDLPTLVFLHEGLGCIEIWRDFPQALCQAVGRNGLVYDRIGYGKSSPLADRRHLNYQEEEALLYLPQILEQLDIHHPILIGHSDGGTIAIIYAAHHSEVVGMIAEAAHVKVEEVTKQGIRTALDNATQNQLLEKLTYFHADKAKALLNGWGDIWLSEEFSTYNIEHLLPKISCPSLIIQGDQDEFASVQHLYDISEGIGSNAEAMLIKDCHHTPHKSHKTLVLEAMKSFIENLPTTNSYNCFS